MRKLGIKLNMTPSEVARGIVRVSNSSMMHAIKMISVNRGEDPRDYTLVAFGGGGGLHAAHLAKELGVKKVVIPRYASVFSALGMLMSPIRRDRFLTKIIDLQKAYALESMQECIN